MITQSHKKWLSKRDFKTTNCAFMLTMLQINPVIIIFQTTSDNMLLVTTSDNVLVVILFDQVTQSTTILTRFSVKYYNTFITLITRLGQPTSV